MKCWIPPLGFLALLSGCSVTALAERERSIAVNRCDDNQDCGGQGLVCAQNRCEASSGKIDALLIEVTPTVGKLSGEQLLMMAPGIPRDGGSHALTLAGVANVTGLTSAFVTDRCAFSRSGEDGTFGVASDGTIPARVTFAPSERSLGLAASVLTADVSGSMTSYQFQAQVPAGTYDVYVEPYDGQSVATDPPFPRTCSIPPELIRGVKLEDGNTKLELKLPKPTYLELEVRWPQGAPEKLNDWSVDMIEPFTGRVVSTTAKLGAPTSAEGVQRYVVGLDYIPVAGEAPATTVDEIVRLTPPAGRVAPTVLFQRSALELFSKGSAVIDQLSSLPRSVSYEGQVNDGKDGQRATVTFVATTLTGVPAGVLTSFVRTVETAEDGGFLVDLLPGTYRVLTVPHASVLASAPLASLESTLQVAADLPNQAGRAIELQRAIEVEGAVVAPNGAGARGALVTAEASPSSVTSGVFERTLDARPLVPRAVGMVIDDSRGKFRLYADPGKFDLSARPPEGSDFAWLVRPGFDLTGEGITALDLEQLVLPGPVRLELGISLPSGDETLLSRAHVRAYALLDESGNLASSPASASSAVPVAEGRIDEQGRATLVLPASLE